jgi:hypothetical protein
MELRQLDAVGPLHHLDAHSDKDGFIAFQRSIFGHRTSFVMGLTMRLKPWLYLLLALHLLIAEAALAATYRWVDQHGKVQYSDVMPPSQAGKGHAELDKQGRVVKEVQRSRLSPEERQQQIDAAARQQAEQRKQVEQRRRDMALLSTYANEKEIALARDRAIELESLNIRGLQTRLDRAAEKLAEANVQLGRYNAAGKPTPAAILQMRTEAQRELAQISLAMDQRSKAVEAIHQRFEEDQQRFLELKSSKR